MWPSLVYLWELKMAQERVQKSETWSPGEPLKEDTKGGDGPHEEDGGSSVRCWRSAGVPYRMQAGRTAAELSGVAAGLSCIAVPPPSGLFFLFSLELRVFLLALSAKC